MCKSAVDPEIAPLLADLMCDIASALSDGHPETVQIGPVDFGGDD